MLRVWELAADLDSVSGVSASILCCVSGSWQPILIPFQESQPVFYKLRVWELAADLDSVSGVSASILCCVSGSWQPILIPFQEIPFQESQPVFYVACLGAGSRS